MISISEPDKFYSEYASKLIKENARVASIVDLKSKVTINLNKAFSTKCVYLTKVGKGIHMKCSYKGCPYEYWYTC